MLLSKIFHHLEKDRIEPRIIYFIFSWIAGLFIGAYYGLKIHLPFETLAFVNGPTSLIGIITVSIFPLILSAIVVHLNAIVLLYPIILWKAVCFSFCSCVILKAFGSSGWLIHPIALFSDACSVLILLGFWIRCIRPCSISIFKITALCLTFLIIVCIISYYLVFPFLAMLFNV